MNGYLSRRTSGRRRTLRTSLTRDGGCRNCQSRVSGSQRLILQEISGRVGCEIVYVLKEDIKGSSETNIYRSLVLE